LIETAVISKEDTFGFLVVFDEKSNAYFLKVYHNEFRDVVEAIPLLFPPVHIKYVGFQDSHYLILTGTSMQYKVYRLKYKKKERALIMLEAKDPPTDFDFKNTCITMDYLHTEGEVYGIFGFADGSIEFLGYKLGNDEEETENNSHVKFRLKDKIVEAVTDLQLPISVVKFLTLNKQLPRKEDINVMASSTLGYLFYFQNMLQKNCFEDVNMIEAYGADQLESIIDFILYDYDNDGQEEVFLLTYLGHLKVFKRFDVEYRQIAEIPLNACFYNIYIEQQGTQTFLILSGDNEVDIFELQE